MPLCSYLVFPRPGARRLADRLRALPECEVTPADNADLLILVTETADAAAEERLQERLREETDIQCMVLTFGDIAPTAEPQAERQAGRRRRRREPATEESLR